MQLNFPIEAPQGFGVPHCSPSLWSVDPTAYRIDGTRPLGRRLRDHTIPLLLDLADPARRRDALADMEPPLAGLPDTNQVFLLADLGPSKGLAAALSSLEQETWEEASATVAWVEQRLRDRFSTEPE